MQRICIKAKFSPQNYLQCTATDVNYGCMPLWTQDGKWWHTFSDGKNKAKIARKRRRERPEKNHRSVQSLGSFQGKWNETPVKCLYCKTGPTAIMALWHLSRNHSVCTSPHWAIINGSNISIAVIFYSRYASVCLLYHPPSLFVCLSLSLYLSASLFLSLSVFLSLFQSNWPRQMATHLVLGSALRFLPSWRSHATVTKCLLMGKFRVSLNEKATVNLRDNKVYLGLDVVG